MSGSPSIESLKKPAILIPLGLFLASFLIRLVGIGWGLPNDLHNQSYHPDETENYAVSQQIDIGSGDFAPSFYNYGSAYFIAENVVDKMFAAYGGQPESRDEKAQWQFVGRQILGGRLISALAGAGTVVVIWLILRRITTQLGALFGSAAVAIAPGFLVHSRFESVDVFATFWLGTSALFSLRILGSLPDSLGAGDQREPRDVRDAILAGVFAGISTGTKYTGILVLIVLWLVLGMTRRSRWWLAALAGTLACFVGFVATTPGFLVESGKFWENLQFEMEHMQTGHGLVFAGTPSGFVYHLFNLAIGVGIFLTLAGVVGLVYASVKKRPWAIALLAFAIVYYIVIGRAEVKFLRYTFPLLIPLAVGYGYAMGTAFRRKTRESLALTAVGVFALSGNPLTLDFGGLIGAARYTQFMTGIDPRDEAATYLKQAAPNGTVGFAKDPWFWSPPLIPDAGLNRGQIRRIYAEVDASQHPKVVRYRPPDGSAALDWDVRLLTESKPDYVVFGSFENIDEERLVGMSGLDPQTQALVDRYKQFVEELQKRYDLARPFGGLVPEIHDLMYIRPTLWVWKRKDLR